MHFHLSYEYIYIASGNLHSNRTHEGKVLFEKHSLVCSVLKGCGQTVIPNIPNVQLPW